MPSPVLLQFRDQKHLSTAAAFKPGLMTKLNYGPHRPPRPVVPVVGAEITITVISAFVPPSEHVGF